jgi:NADPH:quinone reductase-like Zn-dependent oxidoreductase
MRAVVIREHGGTDKLLFEDLPTPVAKPGEVLVRVEAVALNHLDLWVRKGQAGGRTRLPHILGSDIAGTADGKPVVVNPGVSCGHCRECLLGRDNLCREYAILGEHVNGGYAEWLAVPAANVLPRPANLSAAEAAAFPLTFLTAWQMLVHKARVMPGETVLVLGASSGVGVAAIQIAKLFGAHVIASSSSDDKLARARALGADDAINVPPDQLAGAVKQMTGKRGVDVVIEHVGKATWSASILATARGGRIVTCGATSGFDAVTDLRHIFFRQIAILGSTMGSKGDLWDILPHVTSGKLKPVVDRVLPFSRVREAHELLENKKQFGKIVLDLTASG